MVFLLRAIAVREQPERFFDNQKIVVFVSNLKLLLHFDAPLFLPKPRCGFVADVEREFVAVCKQGAFICPFAVHLDVFAYQFIDCPKGGVVKIFF